MHLVQPGCWAYGDVDGSGSFLVRSYNFASAFDPGREVRPIFRAVVAGQLSIVYKDVHSIILIEPRQIVSNPRKEVSMIDTTGYRSLHAACPNCQSRVHWWFTRHVARSDIWPPPCLTCVIHTKGGCNFVSWLKSFIDLVDETMDARQVTEIDRGSYVPLLTRQRVSSCLKIQCIISDIQVYGFVTGSGSACLFSVGIRVVGIVEC